MSQVPLLLDGPLLAEPMILFDGSFILEFLQPPPSPDATVLMRATYKHNQPLNQRAPTLHIHFSQAESLQVLQGKVGTTLGYTTKDRIFTPPDGPYRIDTWVPHTFWPVPNSARDCILLVWAHLSNIPQPVDWVFFANLLGYISDVAAKEVVSDVFQVMRM